MGEDKEFIRARDYAYRLLSYRQRSTEEVKDRLKKKGFSAQSIRATVDYLSRLDYLNDEKFARFWVQTKIQSRPIGYSLLRYQLRQKGVPEEVVGMVLADFSGRYDEAEAAKQIAFSRRNSYKNIAPLKLKRRLYNYLHRRGFTQEAILQAIEESKE